MCENSVQRVTQARDRTTELCSRQQHDESVVKALGYWWEGHDFKSQYLQTAMDGSSWAAALTLNCSAVVCQPKESNLKRYQTLLISTELPNIIKSSRKVHVFPMSAANQSGEDFAKLYEGSWGAITQDMEGTFVRV